MKEKHPANRTFPPVSKVAVYKDRGVIMLPVAVNVPAVGPAPLARRRFPREGASE